MENVMFQQLLEPIFPQAFDGLRISKFPVFILTTRITLIRQGISTRHSMRLRARRVRFTGELGAIMSVFVCYSLVSDFHTGCVRDQLAL